MILNVKVVFIHLYELQGSLVFELGNVRRREEKRPKSVTVERNFVAHSKQA
jgi:hypothetical protein